MKNPLSANQIVARALTNTRKVALCCSATKCLESGVFLDGFLKFLEEICFTFFRHGRSRNLSFIWSNVRSP